MSLDEMLFSEAIIFLSLSRNEVVINNQTTTTSRLLIKEYFQIQCKPREKPFMKY